MKSSIKTAFITALLLLMNGSYPATAQGISEFLFGQTLKSNQSQLLDPNSEVYLDSLVANTSLEQKVGQLFFIPAYGDFTSKKSRTFKELENMVQDYHVGGIIFMQGDIYGQAVLTNKLQRMAKFPLWISQDMEFGAAMRVSGTTRFTPAMGVAASGNKRNAFMMGKITALEAKALGVHQIYAPVLDVNNNPENPVINVRSFSADPDIVTTFGTAFMQGVQSEQLVATAKHFPGHGDTDVDSHHDLPVVRHKYPRLDSLELSPFKAAIRQGIPSIMSAHIAFPNIGSDDYVPGTLDPAILGDILRDSLNFQGMVVTDGLEMRGITSKYSPGEAVVEALQAGADIMLISPDVYTAVDEVIDAVKKGDISEERINQSFRKLMAWKQLYGLFESDNLVNLESLDSRINTPYHQAVADRIARESVTILKNENNILPIQPSEYPEIMVVALADDQSGRTGSSFVLELRNYHPDVSYHVYDERTSERDKQVMLQQARQADLIIIGSFIYLRYGQSIHLSRGQQNFLDKLANTGKPNILVSFGNPYVLSDMKQADVHVQGWYNTGEQVDAVAPALFGASAVKATLPIDIPGLYALGDGINIKHTALRFGNPQDVGLEPEKLYEIDNVLREAIRDSVFPGATVGVVKDGVLAYHQGFGYQDYSKTEAIRATDTYDVASITKVMATTASTMKLVDEGKLGLDDRLAEFFPEFKTDGKADITIRDVLLHQSGLPPFRVYVDSLKSRQAIIEAIKNEPLTYEPGSKYVYSDLGMILLGEIIHEVSGKPLDRYARDEFYYPMGMYSSYFNPVKNSSWLIRRIPPTEIDTVFDRGLVQARVHDERAWFMDGVAGHAGLFSSVVDMAKFSTMLLNEGTYAGRRYLSPETVQLFTKDQSAHNTRGLGFDRKSGQGFSTAGSLASDDTFGHLGFTGTSLWIDRKKNMTIILLTNRTFPHRSYGKTISQIRAEIADIAFSSITK
ncbi:glycoside hydrolase family 3 N-terminal domain-containing protein [Gracilimonas mengyeensis]|uniref:beta-N-acetylhexosaminidase n=1 Tax=Gracilimonas mengyeensis TaxID=1302730 RepID=A0A521FLE7_9BACT|nr:glycoside hydrolase family 3 N-terminal domain-containing protein [Gracilimonas mengyeensis]SMO96936.1 beta-glucosidase [Gracilimonas mengyeensis]